MRITHTWQNLERRFDNAAEQLMVSDMKNGGQVYPTNIKE